MFSNPYEQGLEKLQLLAAWHSTNSGDRNEADTRFMLIDSLFFDCLGWSREDVSMEKAQGRQYADYTFSAPRDLLIVEAKKEGLTFEVPAGSDWIETSLSALLRGNPDLESAVKQATGYCQARGIPYGAVANGTQLVAFIANRQDGIPPLDGRALVFHSLEHMIDNFLTLWNTLSKRGIEDKGLEKHLVGDMAPTLPAKLSASFLTYPGVKNRNPFQSDLKIVGELVLEDIVRTHEIEERFLRECYSQSGALSQYALLSRDILQARYAALFEKGEEGPVLTPAVQKSGITGEFSAARSSRRPLLIIGDVGVGKTTFLRHLMKIDAKVLFADAIALYLDLGSQGTLALSLRQFVLAEIERQLRDSYGVDIHERNFVHGIYHADLERFRHGIHGDLVESNPTLFREKEIAFLDDKLRVHETHIRLSLEHLERGREKQIVLFLDNADQRSDATQQEAFLIAQEFAANWPLAVFVTLRPETFHRSLRSGALSGYHPRAFTISPPRIDLVIEKRLIFALGIATGEVPIESHQGMKARFPNLVALIRVFMASLKTRRELHELIDHVAGGNVRLALDLVKDFMGSGHVDTHKIVKIFEETGRYTVPLHEFLRAVIFGDAMHYDSERSPVANLYDISAPDAREHFLLPLLLSSLGAWSGPGVESGFVETARVYARMQGWGFTPYQIDAALVRAHRHKLIETAARKEPQIGQGLPAAIRVTTVGIYHVKRLTHLFTYLDAIIEDTPVLDATVRANIVAAEPIEDRIARARLFRRYLDDQWKLLGGSDYPFDWSIVSRHVTKDIDRVSRGIRQRREKRRPEAAVRRSRRRRH
jgi:hypothetical protein